MLIQEILAELEKSPHPVAKSYHKNDHFKILIIAFKKGMSLKEHKASVHSKLLVLNGSITYSANDKNIPLSTLEGVDIEQNLHHTVLANEDSICLLSQG